MTKKFEVSANGTVFGVFAADTEQAARDACAVDAGYASEDDMMKRIETPSELIATLAIEYSENERVWFSPGAYIACTVECLGEQITGVFVRNEKSTSFPAFEETYPASVDAIKECRKSGSGTEILTVMRRDQIVVISKKEAKDHGMPEVGLIKIGGKWVVDKDYSNA